MKVKIIGTATVCCGLFIAACASNPYAPANRSYKKQVKELSKVIRQVPVASEGEPVPSKNEWVGTVNLNLRKPNYVIIHHTAQKSAEQTLKTFTTTKSQVSAHYVIAEDGKVYHMLNDYLRAWHAGVSKWGNSTDINSSSIGIEIDNDGYEAFSDAQVRSLLNLLALLKKNHGIPAANFIGHSDVAPGRKVDPNIHFPWKKLAENGYGLWYDEVLTDSVPASFDPIEALRIIGYDIKRPESAIYSFKLHFVQSGNLNVLGDADRRILYNLYKKYL